ncbi:MAG: deoxyribonuclease V [Actinobacteria bacterium]|nr:deoxyribonuclease V [Actinomycetota bacterium]MBU1943102.1 deoxyribonuclease V [Actinomycetota bacterium]MBU2687951.1 deoxyribonuclease V [Actinomycetota bacterium]
MLPGDLTPREAAALQERLASSVVADMPLDLGQIRRVAAADVSYRRGDELTFASLVVMSFPDMEVLEELSGVAPVAFSYVPGLLSFRELPALIPLFERVKHAPDAVLVDGQGIAHPRRIGIASHLGLLFSVPSVGVAKSVLVGEYREPGRRKGAKRPLIFNEEKVGYALRTRDGVKPVFVSPGHLADPESSCALVLACCRGYRLPEPIRAAHALANRARLESYGG